MRRFFGWKSNLIIGMDRSDAAPSYIPILYINPLSKGEDEWP
jgi:hypothetical protein